MEQATTKAIRVHVTAKKSVTQYEPVEVGAALTWTLPDDADENDAAAQQELLYNLLASAVKEQVERLVADMRADLDAQVQAAGAQVRQATSELDQYFGPRAAPPVEPAAVATADGVPILPFKKAAERTPGEEYWTEISEYEVEGQKIKFYGPSSKYPKETTYLDRQSFLTTFNGWQPGPTTQRTPLPGGNAFIRVRVLDKMAGNYYDTDIVGVSRERPQAAA